MNQKQIMVLQDIKLMMRFITSIFAISCLALCSKAFADILVIPSSVKEIKTEAFYGDSSFDEVVLPEGIEIIGGKAFAESGLQKINLPTTLVTIADDCMPPPGLVAVTATTGTYAYDWAVSKGYIADLKCYKFRVLSEETCELTGYIGDKSEIVLPQEDIDGRKVVAIGDRAFYGNETITNIYIPDGVTRIRHSAFANCTALEEIHMPESLETIDYGAFYNCGAEGSRIYFGSNITTINNGWNESVAFGNCKSILVCQLGSKTAIAVSALGLSYMSPDQEDYLYQSTAQTLTLTKYVGAGSIVNVPSGVTNIGEKAFYNNAAITCVQLPEGVIKLGHSAFAYCTALEEVYLPESLEIIDYGVFYNSGTEGSRIYFGSNVTTINNGWNESVTFGKCKSTLICPLGCETAVIVSALDLSYMSPDQEDYLFQSTAQTLTLTKYVGTGSIVNVPSGVTHIGEKAFYNNAAITRVQLPEGVIRLGHSAFAYCTALEEVYLSESLETIDYGAFYNSGAEGSRINFGPNVTTINNGWNEAVTFGKCKSTLICEEESDTAIELTRLGLQYENGALPENTIQGKFDEEIITIPLGGYKQLKGTVTSGRYDIHRVALTIEDYHIEGDDSDRWSWDDFSDHYTRTVKLQYWSAFIIDTATEPFKTPGVYQVSLWANTIYDQIGTLLDTVTVIIEDTQETALMSGQLNSDTVTITLGTSKPLYASISSTSADIGPVYLEVDDQPYSYDDFTGHHLRTVLLQYWAAFTLDTSAAPLNSPGVHTVKLSGQTTDGSETMEPVYLTVTVEEPVLSFYKQPTSEKKAVNETVIFIARATNAVRYQWEMRKNESSEWQETYFPGYDSEVLQFTAQTGINGYQFRCVAYGYNNKTEISQTVTVTVVPIAIKTQPASMEILEPQVATFTVSAVGGGLNYQWQVFNAEENIWKNSDDNGNRTAVLSVVSNREYNGRKYRCMISDSAGNTLVSEEATLTVGWVTIEVSDPLTYFDMAFSIPSTLSNPYLTLCSIYLADGIYEGKASRYLNNLGFESIESYNVAGRHYTDDLVQFYIGHKNIDIEGDKKTVYAVIIRGSTGLDEWYSYFKIGTGGNAWGISLAASDVGKHFIDYFNSHHPSEGFRPVLWTAGHGRGAAVANLFASGMIRNSLFQSENDVYAYCYACPNVTKSGINTTSAIKCFNLNEDIVLEFPLSDWGYSRHGTRFTVCSDTAAASGTEAKYELIAILKEFFPTSASYWDFYSSVNNTYTVNAIMNLLEGDTQWRNIDYLECAKDICNPIIEYCVKKKLKDATMDLADMLIEIGSIIMDDGLEMMGLPSWPADVVEYSARTSIWAENAFETIEEQKSWCEFVAKTECLVYFTAKYLPYAQRHNSQIYLNQIQHYSTAVSMVWEDLHP